MNKVISYNSEKLFHEAVLSSIHSRILKKTLEGIIFRLALSGGSTPGPIYELLATKEDIDWSLVEIYLVDERYVSLTDKNSNYKLIQNALVKNLNTRPKKFVHFNTKVPTKDALKDYEKKLNKSEEEFFDLVLLGIGEDGHTASLFPMSPALNVKDHWVAHTMTDEHPVKDRLTLTYPALESSSEIFFLVKGSKKLDVLKKLESGKAGNKKLPAARLFHLEKSSVFFCEL